MRTTSVQPPPATGETAPRSGPSPSEDTRALLVLLVLTLGLYGSILPCSFTHDDPVILKHVLSHSVPELVASPRAWRDYNPLNFFPEQLWSFKLDVSLFGLEAKALRARQLAGLVAAAFLLFRAIRRFAGPLLSLWGAAVFLAGPVAAGLAQKLMSRHYLDGMALALASYLALRRYATEDPRKRWLAASVFLYFLAILAKEVFAPLPLLAILWLGFRRNLVAWMSLAGALAAAVAYRLFMVGSLARVYQPDIWTVPVLLGNAGRFLQALPGALMGAPGSLAFLALGLLGLSAAAGLRTLGTGLVVLASAAIAVAPAILVAENLDARHVLPLWIVLSAGATYGLAEATRHRPTLLARGAVVLLATAALGATAVGNRLAWSNLLQETRAFDASWDFVYRTGSEGDLFQLSPGVRGFGYSYAAASWLRQHAGDGRPGPRVAGVEDLALCLLDLRPDFRLFRYGGGGVSPDPEFARRLADLCSSARRPGAVRARVSYGADRFAWEIEADPEATSFDLLVFQVDPSLETFAQTYPVPRRGSFWLLPDRGELRIAFLLRAADGSFSSTRATTVPLEEGTTVVLPPA